MIAQGRTSHDPAPVHRALALLDRLQAKATHLGLTWLRVKTLLLQALACDVLGELAPALAAVEQALELAEPETYVRALAKLTSRHCSIVVSRDLARCGETVCHEPVEA